jgi:predicted dienelactone hydrolase
VRFRFEVPLLLLFSFHFFGCGERSSSLSGSFSPPSPWEWGPYPVGVKTDLFFDTTRKALEWKGCGREFCPRPIPVTFWYPAKSTEGSRPVTVGDLLGITSERFSEILNRLKEEVGFEELPTKVDFLSLPLRGVWNPPIAEGRFPLILFSHGAGGIRHQSLFLTEFLASHGFVVLAMDHEGDATYTFVKDDLVLLSFRKFVISAQERPLDCIFLLYKAEEWNQTPGNWLYGHLTSGVAGMTGHSFGAYTSFAVAKMSPLVSTIVPMAAPGFPEMDRSVPTFLLLAGEDATIDTIGNLAGKGVFDLLKTPKGYLNLKDAGHFTFSNLCELVPDFGDGCGRGKRLLTGEPFTYLPTSIAHPLIRGFATAWFGRYLKGITPYEEALKNPPLGDVQVEYLYYP